MRLFRLGLSLFFRREGLLVTLSEKLLGRVKHHEKFVARLLAVASVEKMLQRHGSFQRGDDKDLLFLCPSDPIGKLQRIWHGGTQKNDVDVLRQHDQNLFPNHAAFAEGGRKGKVEPPASRRIQQQPSLLTVPIVDVVNLVKDHPLKISNDVASVVEHRS